MINTICNTPSSIIERATLVEIIPSEVSGFTINRVFKKQSLDTSKVSDLLSIKPLPANCRFNINQKRVDAGTQYDVSLRLNCVPHTKPTQELMEPFMGRWVVAVVHTNTDVYYIGTEEQPLFSLYSDGLDPSEQGRENFLINLSGSSYFAPLRKVNIPTYLSYGNGLLAWKASSPISIS